MPGSGSCACGNVAFEYSGDPALTALCHCYDCQKWTGSAFSSSVAVPTANFSITKGTPKVWTRLGLVSGKEHPHFFCGDCGSHTFSQPVGMPGTTLIKAGTLVDSNIPIAVELFSPKRRDYVRAVAGAQQADQMP